MMGESSRDVKRGGFLVYCGLDDKGARVGDMVGSLVSPS